MQVRLFDDRLLDARGLVQAGVIDATGRSLSNDQAIQPYSAQFAGLECACMSIRDWRFRASLLLGGYRDPPRMKLYCLIGDGKYDITRCAGIRTGTTG